MEKNLQTITPFVSRIDRSVADNLKDIEKSFDEDAGIVKDFIVFIAAQMKIDLFGYSRFTLNDFCKGSGRNKQDLCMKHSVFSRNKKKRPPEVGGFKFETVFDYALYSMVEKNIVFSKSYEYSSSGSIVQLTNFPILKDVKLDVDRKHGGVKVYEIRVSDEMLNGFIRRYYTLETQGYRQVGKGRGGDGRKNLYILLYKTRHQLLSSKVRTTRFAVDYLCYIANIQAVEPKHKKQNVTRVLTYIQEKGRVPFSFTFVAGNPANKYQEEYWVLIEFQDTPALNEGRGDNQFYSQLLTSLNDVYKKLHPNVVIKDEKDAFQRWLANNAVDIEEKSGELIRAYYKAYNKNISSGRAKELIYTGCLIEGIND